MENVQKGGGKLKYEKQYHVYKSIRLLRKPKVSRVGGPKMKMKNENEVNECGV